MYHSFIDMDQGRVPCTLFTYLGCYAAMRGAPMSSGRTIQCLNSLFTIIILLLDSVIHWHSCVERTVACASREQYHHRRTRRQMAEKSKWLRFRFILRRLTAVGLAIVIMPWL